MVIVPLASPETVISMPEAVAEGQQQDQGVVALRLSYVENPEEPDVFSVEIDKDAF